MSAGSRISCGGVLDGRKAEREGESTQVSGEMQRLLGGLNDLCGISHALCDRLNRVTREADPKEKAEGLSTSSNLVPLAGGLADINQRVKYISRVLVDQLDRLEI